MRRTTLDVDQPSLPTRVMVLDARTQHAYPHISSVAALLTHAAGDRRTGPRFTAVLGSERLPLTLPIPDSFDRVLVVVGADGIGLASAVGHVRRHTQPPAGPGGTPGTGTPGRWALAAQGCEHTYAADIGRAAAPIWPFEWWGCFTASTHLAPTFDDVMRRRLGLDVAVRTTTRRPGWDPLPIDRMRVARAAVGRRRRSSSRDAPMEPTGVVD